MKTYQLNVTIHISNKQSTYDDIKILFLYVIRNNSLETKYGQWSSHHTTVEEMPTLSLTNKAIYLEHIFFFVPIWPLTPEAQV